MQHEPQNWNALIQGKLYINKITISIITDI